MPFGKQKEKQQQRRHPDPAVDIRLQRIRDMKQLIDHKVQYHDSLHQDLADLYRDKASVRQSMLDAAKRVEEEIQNLYEQAAKLVAAEAPENLLFL